MKVDEIVTLAKSNFDSEWIAASKKVLFELCPKQRFVVNTGKEKDSLKVKTDTERTGSRLHLFFFFQ